MGYIAVTTKGVHMNSVFEKLIKASEAYYNGHPIMDDSEFDALVDMVTASHPNHPILKTIGAPTRDDSPWTKRSHQIAMGSLSKIVDDNDLAKFMDKHYTENFRKEYVLSEKLDGISINCEYSNGVLIRAITRGSGVEGEDIKRNVLNMNGCNRGISIDRDTSVRGEIIMLEGDFKILNQILVALGEEPYKNMRNCVSGIARRFDGKYSEYLTIRYYDTTIGDLDKAEKFWWLKNHGFDTAEFYIVKTMNEIQAIYQSYVESKREGIDYEIDGLVLEISDRDIRNRMGYKDQKPKFAVAYKFPSLAATTTLLDIEWNVGTGGHITPVAILEPVQIGGITIRRSTLHNQANVKALNLGLNDTVLVSRRNDVIPYVEKVIYSDNNLHFNIPECCPECSEPAIIDGAYLVCENPLCKGNLLGSLMKWIKKSGMDSLGMGEKVIERAFDAELITFPAELYTMSTNKFLQLEGVQNKSATKMMSIIQSHRSLSLADFIGGLNLGSFGSSLAQRLVDAGYDTLEKIQALTIPQMVHVEGMGYKRSGNFIERLFAKTNQINRLLEHVTIEEEKPALEATGDIFNNNSFCFTGAIQKETPEGKRFNRKMMEALVFENGGSTSSVKKGLTYLVQADPDSQSSKTKKAISLGVEILAESDFFKMLGE